MAATVLVGQRAGAGDADGIRRVIGTAHGLLIPLAVLVAILGWLCAPQMLRVLGTPVSATALALSYLRVLLVSMPAGMVLVMLTMSLRGIGDSMTPLWAMILVAVLDMGLNPLLILGLGPCPALGIAGSALATAIANVLGVAALVAYVYRRDLPIRLRGREWRYLIPQRTLVRVIAAKGVPMGMQMIVMALSALAMLGLVDRQGVITTAAYGAVMQLWTYVQMPAMSLGAAVSAMAAQNIGARRWDRIPQITRSGIGINVAMTGAAVLLLTFVDRPALALFLGADQAALQIGHHINVLVSWSFILLGASMVMTSVVRANGAVVVPLLMLVVSRLPIQFGLAVALLPRLGADAIWWASCCSAIAALALSAAYYRYGDWRGPRLGVPSVIEAEEEALADSNPEGRMQPSG
jgi:putative MATE family efflux protein